MRCFEGGCPILLVSHPQTSSYCSHTLENTLTSPEKKRPRHRAREICKMSTQSWITQITNATKVLSCAEARKYKHCNAELCDWGHCFWRILNNAFLHKRRLPAVFLFFFLPVLQIHTDYTNTHKHNDFTRPSTRSRKYASCHKVSRDGAGKTVGFVINNVRACAELGTQTQTRLGEKKNKKNTKIHLESVFSVKLCT